MSEKKIRFELDRSLSRYSKPSNFDRIIKEITPSEIPVKYIHNVLIQYYDGNVVEFKGDDLSHPVPFGGTIYWEDIGNSYKPMQDIHIFIFTDQLEHDINRLVEEYLGPYC